MCRWALILPLLLAACGSGPPTRFYTLSPVPPAPGVSADPVTVGSGAPVRVQGVSIPPSIDRLSYVQQIGPNQLDVSDQARWASPLDGMIRQVVAADLMSRLPQGAVLAAGDPGSDRTRAIDLTIIRFMGDQSGAVVLQCDWSLLDGRTQAVLARRHEQLTGHASPASPEAVTAVMSALLGELAGRIAAAV